MNASQREQLRLSLIRFLDANNTRYGLSTDLLWQMARAEGRHELPRKIVETELQYLLDKDLAAEVLKHVSPENRCWRITAAGRDYYAQFSAE